jgi:hypothetical protein
VTTLEQDLRLLGRELDYPREPDLRNAVVTRVERRRRRKRVVLAFAALIVLALAVALAVPQARSAIQRWLRIGVVRVELVDELPKLRIQSRLLLGERVSLGEAQRRFGRPVALPDLKEVGPPDHVYFFGEGPSRRVTVLWGSRSGPKLLLQQFRGTLEPEFGKKIASGGTDVRFANVNHHPALGLFGAPHYFMYLDPETHQGVTDRVYLVGNVLLWQSPDGAVTLRLEGDLDFAEMLRIARRTR